MSEWDKQKQELEDEKRLLSRLNELEVHAKAAAEMKITGTRNLAKEFLTLSRAYKRKFHEARDLKDYLSKLKDYFTECWDEEDEHFDPTYASDGVTSRYDWCPTLIEEIGEMIAEGTVWVPHDLPKGVTG